MITLLTHLSPGDIASALTGPGDLDPLLTSLESGGVTLAVLIVVCTPLAWLLARGRLPLPRLWEAGILARCCSRRWSSGCCWSSWSARTRR